MSNSKPHPRLPGRSGCLLIGFLVQTVAGLQAADQNGRDEQNAFFQNRVQPLLIKRCGDCHSADGGEKDLDLTTAAGLVKGSSSGGVVVPGDAGRSRLVQAVRYQTALKMPPEGRLDADEIAVLELWVRSGAVIPDAVIPKQPDRPPHGDGTADSSSGWWAFRPVEAPVLPTVSGKDRIRTPVDRFILKRLENEGLTFAPDTDRRTLIRRATFDLTGLPPTPDEVDAFLQDLRPGAFERLVERLLASPHYGERWGRHWLDVARYADTNGGGFDYVYPNAWQYRDYVVRSFNSDKPYDEFLQEQLAGDLLPVPGDPDTVAERLRATGLLTLVPRKLGMIDKEQMILDMIDGQIDVVGRALTGLTLSCARCHDHKHDPITIREYYALAGIFRSTVMLTDVNRVPSYWPEQPLPASAGETVMAVRDKNAAVDACVLIGGDYRNPAEQVPRGVPQIFLSPDRGRTDNSAPKGSGRLELARRLTDPDHPLTARVFVNRVWQHHFGQGLVATPDNFGRRGAQPSHPELLDWLAGRFVQDGWSVKKLHRHIMYATVYRQSSSPGRMYADAACRIDSGNRLLWKMNRRHLEAEAVRDAILSVSGRLDRTVGGDVSRLQPKSFLLGDVERHLSEAQQTRRSLYLPVVRTQASHEILQQFNGSDPNAVTAKRDVTVVASQALYFLNNSFVSDQSKVFSERLQNSDVSDAERVRTGYRLALSRIPSDTELKRALEFLEHSPKDKAWPMFCQSLFCLNEFIYVD